MTFKKIMLIFCIGLPVCIAARIFQITKTIDYANGFYLPEQKITGNLILFVIILICLGLGFAAYKTYKMPENPPKTNFLLALASVTVAIVLIFEFFKESMPVALATWQIVVFKFVTFICILYFLVIAVKEFLGIRISALIHIIPCIYAMTRTIVTFIKISTLAIISDNVLLVAAYCVLMIFFINYGKLYNNIDTELNFRKILASGLTASMLCLTQSVAYILINILGNQPYSHVDLSTMLRMFVFGVFTIVFTVSHFRKTA